IRDGHVTGVQTCALPISRRSPTGRPRAWRAWCAASSVEVLIYASIYIAAILEGEIYYSKVCADAVAGRLHWLPVLLAGALGGSRSEERRVGEECRWRVVR